MSTVTLYTLWGLRKNETEPEMMEAWDYFSVDGYPDGWNDACATAIQSWGDDLVAHRYIDIDVDLGAVKAAFGQTRITGDITSAKDGHAD